MLDVYRNYYGLTGEPFRLGPDYRFSLHHESYANAKAYLEYAIYQGEGFIAITGGPGTGKTTLISEILAGLDREKVQVATLTSTQLESRDLLYMVASSFDLHPEDASKANLLVEIESFLVRKIRNGQRAILIVDEAQGLSKGALEELRLLANLQYQYQLLLQIFLVGQERLLELIRAPGMEHLHQRLVAATSLEPLSFDETVDYVEHRLSKVGWSGVPSIDEAALREVYRYSGGIPRRINLIANRLFLYGGMEKKQRFDVDDTRNVIQGLIEEFLLAPEPLIAEADVAIVSGPKGEERSRSLPRNNAMPTQAPSSRKTAATHKPETAPSSAEVSRSTTAPGPAAKGSEAVRKKATTLPTENRPIAPPRNQTAAGAKTKTETKAPSVAPKPPPRPAPAVRKRVVKLERPVPGKPAIGSSRKPDRKGSGKGIAMAVFLLAGAGATYLLRDQTGDQGQVYKPVDQVVESVAPIPIAPQPKTDKGLEPAADVLPVEESQAGIIVTAVGESKPDDQRSPKTADRGEIIREQPSEPLDTVVESETQAIAPAPAEAKSAEPPVQAEPQASTPLAKTVAESPTPVQSEPAPVTGNETDKPREQEKVAQTEPAKQRRDEVQPAPAVSARQTAKPDEVENFAQPVTAKQRRDEAQPTPAVSARQTGKTGEVDKIAPPATAKKRTDEPAPTSLVKPVERLAKADTAAAGQPDGAVTEPPEPTDIDLQRSRLREAARQRFSARQGSIQQPKSEPAAATRNVKPDAVQAKEVTQIATLSKPTRVQKTPRFSANEIAAKLLDGRWSSSGKPASLLPSATTYCHKQAGEIKCQSVPQNVKTQYGPATYKVETTLSGFSAQGHFEMSYRTLVKLMSAETTASDNSGWQITNYSMSCILNKADQVSCLDDKGISREYRQAGPGRQ